MLYTGFFIGAVRCDWVGQAVASHRDPVEARVGSAKQSRCRSGECGATAAVLCILPLECAWPQLCPTASINVKATFFYRNANNVLFSLQGVGKSGGSENDRTGMLRQVFAPSLAKSVRSRIKANSHIS